MIILLTLILLVVIAECILLFSLILLKDEGSESSSGGFVSILVPARNEEQTISETLHNLLIQDYPADKFEILIGDDDSTDGTATVIKSISKEKENVHYFFIEEGEKKIAGKAGVLDILMSKAKGEVILIADADMTYPPTWIQVMSGFINKGILVSSFTKVEGTTVWSQFQNMDWLLNFSGVKMLSKYGFSLTAIGNNMGFLRSDYTKVAGFGQMKGFITEDMELLKQMRSASIPSKLIFSIRTLGITRPVPDLKSIIEQRLRWMTGAFKSPPWLVAGWTLRVFLLLIIIALAFFNLKWSLVAYFGHFIIQCLILIVISLKLKEKIPPVPLVLFDFFYFFLNILCLINYLSSKKITWKDRSYYKTELSS